MNGDELQDGLRRLAGAGPREAGIAVERELRAKFRTQRKQTKPVWTYAAEVAAVLVAMATLYLVLTHAKADERQATVARQVNLSADFIALPYAQSDVPMEQPVIVRVKIPVAELGGMGVLVDASFGSRSVSADLLVGQDGVARAVRLVE